MVDEGNAFVIVLVHVNVDEFALVNEEGCFCVPEVKFEALGILNLRSFPRSPEALAENVFLVVHSSHRFDFCLSIGWSEFFCYIDLPIDALDCPSVFLVTPIRGMLPPIVG